MLTLREKAPLPEGSEQGWTCDAALQRIASPTHYQLSYSCPEQQTNNNKKANAQMIHIHQLPYFPAPISLRYLTIANVMHDYFMPLWLWMKVKFNGNGTKLLRQMVTIIVQTLKEIGSYASRVSEHVRCVSVLLFCLLKNSPTWGCFSWTTVKEHERKHDFFF